MKVYNKSFKLDNNLLEELNLIRKNKNFNSKDYVHQKINLINKYFKHHNLKAAVIGVSGGVDSALVLALLDKAKKVKGSPIEKIIPVFLPVFNSQAATNQKEATKKGEELCLSLGIAGHCLNLSKVHKDLDEIVAKSLSLSPKAWAQGQLVAYCRTPALYYITSLLTQESLPAVVCGTTNKDEGLYLGYFGKASDGMVDLQLISDLHKSEVFAVAKYLKVPESILNAPPSGDMYDGRDDEEVFGASYDFVELYLHYLSIKNKKSFLKKIQKSLPLFKKMAKNLESLHKYNAHKYSVGSPAMHLDLYKNHIKNGWKVNVYEP